MYYLTHPLSSVAIGVCFALFVALVLTDNPASIPFRKIAVRALPGIVFFLVLWTLLGFVVCQLAVFPELEDAPVPQWCVGILVGIFLPWILYGLKNRVPRRLAAKSTLIRSLLRIAQSLDDITRLYVKNIIDREERKANMDFFSSGAAQHTAPSQGNPGNPGTRPTPHQQAVDRLYEFLVVDIAREHRNPGLFKVRNRDMKFKFVLRYLGYDLGLAFLYRLASDPGTLLPSWPPGIGDRRQVTMEKPPHRRRKVDQRFIIAYVYGISENGEGESSDSVG